MCALTHSRQKSGMGSINSTASLRQIRGGPLTIGQIQQLIPTPTIPHPHSNHPSSPLQPPLIPTPTTPHSIPSPQKDKVDLQKYFSEWKIRHYDQAREVGVSLERCAHFEVCATLLAGVPTPHHMYLTYHTSHHTYHTTPHPSHHTYHTSHITSHPTPHISHLTTHHTPHISHTTPHISHQSFTSSLAEHHHSRQLKSRVLLTWFGTIRGRWKQRLEKSCQVYMGVWLWGRGGG